MTYCTCCGRSTHDFAIENFVRGRTTEQNRSTRAPEPDNATGSAFAERSQPGLDGGLAEVFYEARTRAAACGRTMASTDDVVRALSRMISAASDLADAGINATELRRALRKIPHDASNADTGSSAGDIDELEDALRLISGTEHRRAGVRDLIQLLLRSSDRSLVMTTFLRIASARRQADSTADVRPVRSDTTAETTSFADTSSSIGRSSPPTRNARLRLRPSRGTDDDASGIGSRVDRLSQDLNALCMHVEQLTQVVKTQHATGVDRHQTADTTSEAFVIFSREMTRQMTRFTDSIAMLSDRVADLEHRSTRNRSPDRAQPKPNTSSARGVDTDVEAHSESRTSSSNQNRRGQWLPDALPLIPRHRRTEASTSESAESATERSRAGSPGRRSRRSDRLRRTREQFRRRARAMRTARRERNRATGRRWSRSGAFSGLERRGIRGTDELTSRQHRKADLDRQSRQDRTQDAVRFYLSIDDPVVDAPSIGPRTAARLEAVGIHTVRDLLDADAEMSAAELDARHITADVIEAWKKQARLVLTIPFLRGTHAQLFVGAGFDDAGAITRTPKTEILASILRFAATRDGQRLLRDGPPPPQEKIEAWVDNAERAEPSRAA